MAEAGGCDPRPSQRSCRRNPALNPKPRFKTSAQHGRRSNKSTRSSKRCTPWSSGASSKQRRAGSAGSRLLPRVGNFLKGGSIPVRAGMPEGSTGPLPSQVHLPLVFRATEPCIRKWPSTRLRTSMRGTPRLKNSLIPILAFCDTIDACLSKARQDSDGGLLAREGGRAAESRGKLAAVRCKIT